MKAFHNKQEIKDKYIELLKKDYITGYFKEFAGRGIIRRENNNIIFRKSLLNLLNNDYRNYENLLQIPEWIGHIKEIFYCGISPEKVNTYSLLFLEAIKVGADLEKIKSPFMIYLLRDLLYLFTEIKSDIKNDQYNRIILIIKTTISLYENINEIKDHKIFELISRIIVIFVMEISQTNSNINIIAELICAISGDPWILIGVSKGEQAKFAYEKYANKLLELLKECE